MARDEDALPFPTAADLQRIEALQYEIGGPNVGWGAAHKLDVLIAEHRIRAERLASERLTRATWALAGATGVLALATIGLIVATLS